MKLKEIEDRFNKWKGAIASGFTKPHFHEWSPEIEWLISEVKRLREERHLCPNCLQMLEPDGSCLTCRMAEEVKRLQERQKWIDEVPRKQHPDDERPWCNAYLDCRAEIKRLREGIERHRILNEYRFSWDKELYRLLEEK